MEAIVAQHQSPQLGRRTILVIDPRMDLSGPPVIIGRKSPSGKTVVTKSRSGGRRVVKSRNRSYTPRQTMIFSDKRGYNHITSRLHPIQHRVQTTSRPILTTTYRSQIKREDSLEDDEDMNLDDLTSGYPVMKDCEINLYSKTYLRGSRMTIIDSTVTDLSLYSFDDKLKSLEVKGQCCWVIFADKHFGGPQKQFHTGQYKSSTMIGANLVGEASSLKISVC